MHHTMHALARPQLSASVVSALKVGLCLQFVARRSAGVSSKGITAKQRPEGKPLQ